MVNTREITGQERDRWDTEIRRFEFTHPLNAYGWGQVRSVDGWRSRYIVAERDGSFCGCIMILEKKIPFTPFSVLYGQRGPVWDKADDETLFALIEAAKDIAKNTKAIFLRIDPNMPESMLDNMSDKLSKVGFARLRNRWSAWNSPKDVFRINLTKFSSTEQFFNALEYNPRKCIRKAAKEGVTVEVAENETDLNTFYGIFKEFTGEKGFMARDFSYQKALWNEFVSRGNGRLFLAKYQGKTIGGLICIMFAGKCVAMHMGTPYKYHTLYTFYAYVWESIKWAIMNGCSWYSFRGRGSTSSQEYFKRKFMTEEVRLIGYFDLPFNKILYRVFNFAEYYILGVAVDLIVNCRIFFNKLLNIFRSRLNNNKIRQ